MTKEKKLGFSQPMTSMDYFFSDGISHRRILAALRNAKQKTPLRQNDTETLLFVKSGNGVLESGARSYSLCRGALLAISDYQSYRIKPDVGSVLVYAEVQFDYMMYLFFMANPYFNFTSPGLGPYPVYCITEGSAAETADFLTDSLIERCSRGILAEREVLQTMELFGILIEASDAEENYPNPSATDLPPNPAKREMSGRKRRKNPSSGKTDGKIPIWVQK